MLSLDELDLLEEHVIDALNVIERQTFVDEMVLPTALIWLEELRAFIRYCQESQLTLMELAAGAALPWRPNGYPLAS